MSIFNSRKNPQKAEPEAEPAPEPEAAPEDVPQKTEPVPEVAPADEHVGDAVVAEDVVTGEPVIQTDVSRTTAAHLMTYPLVKETIEIVDSIPGVKGAKGTAASIVDPTIGFVLKQPIIKPVVETCDSFAEQTLSTIDNTAPCLQTTIYSTVGTAIQKPFVETRKVISNATQATFDAIENNIILPTKNGVHDFRSYYNQNIYDTQGKPLLRSSLDPVFRPINCAIDGFTAKNYEPTENVVSKDFSSEVERNLWLSLDLAKRTVPVIHDKVTEFVMMPCNYTQHAIDVFNENLDKQEKKNISTSIAATYNSSIDLAEEAWVSTVDIWNHVFGSKKEAEEASQNVQIVAATTKQDSINALSNEQAPVVEAK